ncbi:unnamed protein product [Brassica napus]|nr:unnamed protein product [Brassica napus]
MSEKPTSVLPVSDSRSRSRNTVHDLTNFRVLPPKTSSPFQTNNASCSSNSPALFPSPKPNIVLPPNPTCVPPEPVPPEPVLPPQPSHPLPPPSFAETASNTFPNLAERLRKSVDKTLLRLAPVTVSDSGRPCVLIPDRVFQKGAEMHKDFIVCYFNGRPPPFNHTQKVLNHLWGKGIRVEIHSNPHTRSMLVRIPSDYLRQKILEKRVWYVGDSMFQAVQWSSSASTSSPPLESIQIWAHLKGIPLDLRHSEGYSLIAGLVGEPKETDDFTLNLVSLTMSHVKVAVDLTKPLPSVVEFTRQSGEVVEVSVSYPWVPPTCSHCNELGHIMKNCLQLPHHVKQNTGHRKGKEPEASVNVPAKDSSSTFVEEVSVDPPARSVVLASSSSQPPDPLPCSLPPLEKPTPIFPFSLPHSPQKYPHIKPNHPSHPPILMPSLPSPHKPLSLFVSPTSPPEQPKKRPRPCSTQTFPSFTDQLNFFSVPKSPIRPPLLLPPAPSDILSFGSNPFAILSSQGPLPSEEVID